MKTELIHPEESQNLAYWAGKWGISVQQLKLAIVDTGYLRPAELKTYLKKKGAFSSSGMFKQFIAGLIA